MKIQPQSSSWGIFQWDCYTSAILKLPLHVVLYDVQVLPHTCYLICLYTRPNFLWNSHCSSEVLIEMKLFFLPTGCLTWMWVAVYNIQEDQRKTSEELIPKIMTIGRTPGLWVVALKIDYIIIETSVPFSLTRQRRVKKQTADPNI